ncbi:hypothetical protein EV191_12521 [Tamaricihabitans halophyticus]|uniref:Magnesium transporter NIPA n=1 Tax=Tamaricihabitans halophyticus TaxID=1262583 RepID=A0A4V2SR47_9PSEU|nr:hypothetical protein [Tamaricihabitans halophyticus]TCP41636.1 hypothetical protein EV191_12521 [Tamaricihabitans halophyticus]
MLAVGIVLAVIAAGCFAMAAQLQHGAVHATADSANQPRVRALLRNRRWLLGMLGLGAGAGLHAAALAFAPLPVIQPIGVLAVVGSTWFIARTQQRRLWPGELIALGMTLAGVLGFVLLAVPAVEDTATIAWGQAIDATALVGGAALLLALVGSLGRGIGRSLGFATAAAACYGLVSVLTRVTLVQFESTGISTGSVVAVAGIIAAAVLGGWLIQHAYAAGSPDSVLACLTVGDPVIAVGAGALVLGETMISNTALAPVQAASVALAVGGIATLARLRTARPDRAGKAAISTSVTSGCTSHNNHEEFHHDRVAASTDIR